MSIADVVDDSNKQPKKTIFCVLNKDGNSDKKFSKGQLKSLTAVEKMVEENGGIVLKNLKEIEIFLNDV